MSSGRREGAAPLPAPELPARYTLPRLLAHGGMGSVWCAEDAALQRRVAVKLLSESLIDDHSAVRRFTREARAAARLSGHANVVTIYDVGSCAGRPYIVMEHLAGGTVADALRLDAYSRAEALRWIAQVAAALDYAHGRGVVHRDVKPANMLLGVDRVLRLADFGIASLGTDQTLSRTGELFGTAAYLAPEQAVGEPASTASDRYALAVAAFELLTGTRPFDGDSFTAQARAHIEDPPPRASVRAEDLPPAVDAVLQRGMAKAPEERWPTAQSFAEALRGAISGERTGGFVALPRPSLPRPRPRVRAERPSAEPPLVIFDSVASAGTRRLRAPVAAVLALALVALIGGILVGTGSGGAGGSRDARATVGASTLKPAASPKSKPAAQAARSTASHSATTAGATPVHDSLTLATELEARGHTLMLDGAYTQALPVLRQAVAAAPRSTLTYAYALYDLGRTLRLAGHPAQAIPILEQRLQIPNQPAAVEQELVLAKAAAAAQGSGSATGQGTTTTPTSSAPSTTGPTTTTPSTPTAPTPPAPSGGAGLGGAAPQSGPTGGSAIGPGHLHGHGHGHGHGRFRGDALSSWIASYPD
jgi:tRNA A-37 threonylcarbamoyl transferase component Bud32